MKFFQLGLFLVIFLIIFVLMLEEAPKDIEQGQPVVAASELTTLQKVVYKIVGEDPLPEEDPVQAPFREPGQISDTSTAQRMGLTYQPPVSEETAITIDQPHRTPNKALEWVAAFASRSLNLDPLRYESHIADASTYMTPYAVDALKEYLNRDQLLEAVRSNNLTMRAFVEGPGRILNQGAVQGRYRWLVETPVTVTFLPRDTIDYSEVTPKNRRMKIRTQVGRVPQGGNEGMLIETWDAIPVVENQ